MTNYYDNTLVSTYRRCPRFFYFRHELNWTPDITRYPLAFGGAWHKAMDVVWKGLILPSSPINPDHIAELAYDAFLLAWIGEYKLDHPDNMGPEEMQKVGMRHPFTAQEMLINYIAVRQAWISECELLSTERPFIISLSDTLNYAGRLDKVVRRRGKIYVIEHKTTSAYLKDGPFRASFISSFTPDSQIDGYLYAGHELYGSEFAGLYVDAALVHKTIHDGFAMIPVQRHPKQLGAWKWETEKWIEQIQMQQLRMETFEDFSQFMRAWPKNTNSCWDFNAACPYLDLCKSWPDPRGKELPAGYVMDEWDPFIRLELEGLKT